jgi:hypothetical protein
VAARDRADARSVRGGSRLNVRAEAVALKALLGGRAVVCRPEGGWPPALALRVEGEEPAYEWPCPYGNFARVRFSEPAMERLGRDGDYRDLLTLAELEPELWT